MPEVDHDPDIGQAGLVEQVEGLGDRRDQREPVALGGMDRLETEPNARVVGGGGDPAQAVDHELPRLVLVPVAGRPGQAEHAVGLERREPVHRRAERADALLDVLRALDHRVRQDRRHGRDAVGHLQAARAQRRQVVLVVAELHLPDPDPVEARRRIGAEVVAEARGDGRDLAQRQLHGTPGTFASSRRAAAAGSAASLRDTRSRRRGRGPGWVLAPMWKRRSTGVSCPGEAGVGRKSRFWSSAHEPA